MFMSLNMLMIRLLVVGLYGLYNNGEAKANITRYVCIIFTFVNMIAELDYK